MVDKPLDCPPRQRRQKKVLPWQFTRGSRFGCCWPSSWAWAYWRWLAGDQADRGDDPPAARDDRLRVGVHPGLSHHRRRDPPRIMPDKGADGGQPTTESQSKLGFFSPLVASMFAIVACGAVILTLNHCVARARTSSTTFRLTTAPERSCSRARACCRPTAKSSLKRVAGGESFLGLGARARWGSSSISPISWAA